MTRTLALGRPDEAFACPLGTRESTITTTTATRDPATRGILMSFATLPVLSDHLPSEIVGPGYPIMEQSHAKANKTGKHPIGAWEPPVHAEQTPKQPTELPDDPFKCEPDSPTGGRRNSESARARRHST